MSIAPGVVSPESVPIDPLTPGYCPLATTPAAMIQEIRLAVAAGRECLLARFNSGTPAHELVSQRARQIDIALGVLWRQFALHEVAKIALVAVGGYGRAELHPGSDIDLLVLLQSPPKPDLSSQLREFTTSLWDIGLQVGHSVRTVRECVAESKRDITVATSLMEARHLLGSADLFANMRKRTGQQYIWPSRKFFAAKLNEQVQRHHKYHDTEYNLEPNVKEGPGGLRDIQMIGWVAKRHFGAETLRELVVHEFLTESEFRSLTAGQNYLWQIRFALHAITGRCEDRLLFDYQRSLAKRFGLMDDEHHLGVEKLMKQYYREIKELSRLNEMLLELFQEAILLNSRATKVVPINDRFQSVNGFLEVTGPSVFTRNPCALLELFLVLQQRPKLNGVRASTIRLVRDHRYLIDETFRADQTARNLFLEILRQPRGITHELRRMHRYGVLEAYLPVFAAVVGQMQYDLFHAYTVDEHSLFVVSNIRSFSVAERAHEFPRCSKIFAQIAKPELLYIAGLFHDIAKGRGGDHSELGGDEASAFCLHHGLSKYHANVVSWLVRHHLLMSVTAQRKDITDPDVIADFAATVGDQDHLDYLYLLTVADIRGTNESLWNDWKDSLLWDLYQATSRALRRGLENPIDRLELVEDTRCQAREILRHDRLKEQSFDELWESLGEEYFLRFSADEVAWHTRAILKHTKIDTPLVMVRQAPGSTLISVYAPDQEFLFAASTSILGRLGLNILDARIFTAANGMTIDSYAVLDLDGAPITDRSQQRAIQHTLATGLQQPATVIRQVSRRARRQLKHFPIPTQVSFHRAGTSKRTTMEVVASDRPGLLSRIGWALADAKVRLQNAKVATFGERAEDVFYITDSKNQPLQPDALDALHTRACKAIDAS